MSLKILLVVEVISVIVFAPVPFLDSEAVDFSRNLDASSSEIDDLGCDHEALSVSEVILRGEVVSVFIRQQLHAAPLHRVLKLVDRISNQEQC